MFGIGSTFRFGTHHKNSVDLTMSGTYEHKGVGPHNLTVKKGLVLFGRICFNKILKLYRPYG